MDRSATRAKRRHRRRKGLRKRIFGTPTHPRLSVYRSLKHTYAQIIDDVTGVTLAAASTRDKDFSGDNSGNVGAAKSIGTLLAERAKSKGIDAVKFDRSGFRYHGRVKALAEAAREGGLKF